MNLTPTQYSSVMRLKRFISDSYSQERTGHDVYHIFRVYALTSQLVDYQDDGYYCLCLALLHEECDDKLKDNADPYLAISTCLDHAKIHDIDIQRMADDVLSIGYKGGFNDTMQSREAQLVSDADFLEAQGAIGIGRTFYYAGSKGNVFHDPELADVSAGNYQEYRHLSRNVIAHFDEKLLHLIDRMQTDKGRVMAQKRHERIQQFYSDFLEEIENASCEDISFES